MSSLAGGCFHGEDKDPLDKVIGLCFLALIAIIIYSAITKPEAAPQDSSKKEQHVTSK